jgi:hypothetical protein
MPLASPSQLMAAAGAGGGPTMPAAQTIAPNKTRLDDTADLRDSISVLLGKGYTANPGDEDMKAHQARVLALLGPAAGQQLLSHLQVFNQRPGMDKLSPDERVQQLYSLGSQHPVVGPILNRVKSFGTGPTSGFRESVDVANQKLQGTYKNAPERMSNAVSEAIRKQMGQRTGNPTGSY